MVRHNQQLNLSRRLIIEGVIALGVFICIGMAAYNFKQHKSVPTNTSSSSPQIINPVNTVDYSPATQDNTATEERKNNPSRASHTLSNGSVTPDTPPAMSITITRASKDQANQNLQVATLIEGTTSGVCTTTVSKKGQTSITRQAKVELQTNSYVCPVQTIPLSEFPELGSWNISVSLVANGQTKTNNWAANPISL